MQAFFEIARGCSMNTENQELPFNMPEGFKLKPAFSSSTEASVFISIDHLFENGEWYQTRGLTPAEAGELAYALHNAATRAIAMAHEMKEAEETGRPGIGLPVEEVDKIANVTNRQIDFLHSSIQILIRKVEELEETVFGEEV